MSLMILKHERNPFKSLLYIIWLFLRENSIHLAAQRCKLWDTIILILKPLVVVRIMQYFGKHTDKCNHMEELSILKWRMMRINGLVKTINQYRYWLFLYCHFILNIIRQEFCYLLSNQSSIRLYEAFDLQDDEDLSHMKLISFSYFFNKGIRSKDMSCVKALSLYN